MKFLLAFLLAVLSFPSLSGQNAVVGKHALFVEFRGLSGFYSLNYDRILFVPEPFKISARVGITLLRGADYNNHKTIEYSIPIMLNVLYGKSNHHLEVGGGIWITTGYYNETFAYLNPPRDTVVRSTFAGYPFFIGYRYQEPDGGFMFRFGWYPLDDILADENWIGLGLGYNF